MTDSHASMAQAWLDIEEEVLQGGVPELENEYFRMVRNQRLINSQQELDEINEDPEINALYELDALERSSFR